MSSTRTQIRQEAAARIGSIAYPYPCTGTSGGSTTTAVVSEFIDSIDSEYRNVGSWAYFLNGTNAGAVRRVQSYAPTTGTLTFNRALSASVASGDTFELHEWFDPRIWHDCINRALRNTPRMRREEITIVTNQRQYTLWQPWITKVDQIFRLVMRYGSTANEYTYREVSRQRWHVDIDDDVLVLNLTEPYTNQSNVALFMDATGPYSELTSDSSSTTCNLDWIVFGTLKQAYDVYGKIIDDGNKKTILIDKDEVMRRHQQLTREHAPRFNPVLRVAPPGRA